MAKLTSEDMQRLFYRTEEELFTMDEVEFKARFRERCHHTLEIQVYEAAYKGKKLNARQTETAEKHLKVWDKRGLSHDLPEYKFATQLIAFAKKLMAGEKIDLSQYNPKWLSEDEMRVFDRVLYERRSVRQWDLSRRVPDELIDAILNAGLWAAHSCNLQSIRYLVIREENEPGLFRGSDIPGGPVHIVLMQDMRNYRGNQAMPDYNKLLDCGAAGQNIVLAAHAYGLGGTWLTFNEDKMCQRLIKRFSIPEEIKVVTYVDIGYPDQTPFPPCRIDPEQAVFARV